MRIVSTLLDILCTFNEAFWLYCWIDIFFDRKVFSAGKCGGYIPIKGILEIIYVILIFGLNRIALTSPYTMTFIMLWNIVTTLCFWKGGIMRCMAIVGGYFLCLFLKGNIEISLTGIIGGDELIRQTTLEQGLIRSIYILLGGMGWFLLNRYGTRYAKRKPFQMQGMRYITIISVIGYIGCAFIGGMMLQSFSIHVGLIWYVFLAILLVILVGCYALLKYKDEKLRMTVLQAKNEMLERNYMQVNEFYTTNAKLYHDMNHHFDAVYHMLQQSRIEQAKDYIESLQMQKKTMEIEVRTGLNVLDAILHEMDKKAEEQGIVLKVEAPLLPYDLGIENSDICSLFSNLLENALEAAPKEIDLQIKRINRSLYILVRNDYEICPVMKNGRFISHKDDKNSHGWGTQIVEQIVRKYEGDIKYEMQNGYFEVRLLLNEQIKV